MRTLHEGSITALLCLHTLNAMVTWLRALESAGKQKQCNAVTMHALDL